MADELERYATFAAFPSTNVGASVLASAGFLYKGNGDEATCYSCGLKVKGWKPGDNPDEIHKRLSPDCEHYGVSARLKSYSTWPSHHTLLPKDLAEAGFIYSGKDDCVQCTKCKGFLDKWQPGYIPLDEHARWFPGCQFVRKIKGKEFCESVQQHFGYEMEYSNKEGNTIDQHSAVQSVSIYGYEEDVIREGLDLFKKRKEIKFLSAKNLLELVLEVEERETANAEEAEERKTNKELRVLEQRVEELEKEKEEYKTRSLCKICFLTLADVAFYPCFHMGTCVQCSDSFKECPFCRTVINQKCKMYIV